jgi:hypothetical protein
MNKNDCYLNDLYINRGDKRRIKMQNSRAENFSGTIALSFIAVIINCLQC